MLLAIPGLVLLLTLIAFLAPPGKSSPTTQTFWATVALAILADPRRRPRHPGADDGLVRPRLRDGVADARAPATSGS